MVKVWELAQGRRPADRGSRNVRPADHDLVILDAPATGHALAMLRAPRTFTAIARVGPIARQAGQVRELLEDPVRSAYLAVAHPTEMAVTETLELREGLRRELSRELDAVVVNGALPRRFQGSELQRIAALNGASADGRAVTRAAIRAAHAVHQRARSQQSQIARLRREDVDVVTVPFAFEAELGLADVARIAERLDTALSHSRRRAG